MNSISPPKEIVALLYSEGDAAARILRRLSETLREAGVACAGYIEKSVPPRPGRSRCDMIIENLSTGERLTISRDLGPFARGCRLDTDVLATAIEKGRHSLELRPDILIVNKFGKSESAGQGFRPLIVEALERGIPVLIAVPWKNVDSWRQFSGDFSRELAIEGGPREVDEVLELLCLVRPADGCIDGARPARA